MQTEANPFVAVRMGCYPPKLVSHDVLHLQYVVASRLRHSHIGHFRQPGGRQCFSMKANS